MATDAEDTEPGGSSGRPRLRDRLSRTRAAFASHLPTRGRIDDEAWDELEEALLLADVGMTTTEGLLEHVRARVRAAHVRDAEDLPGVLEAEIVAWLDPETDRTLRRNID